MRLVADSAGALDAPQGAEGKSASNAGDTADAPQPERLYVTLAPVDTSKVPSQIEIMAAGGMAGPLYPLGNADVKKFKKLLADRFGYDSDKGFDQAAQNADDALKSGVLMDEEHTQKAEAVVKARDKAKRLEEINISFAKAINERRLRHFNETARLMNEHLKKYPDSPWAGEAMLHLAMDAMSNGRPGEAQQRLQTLLEVTKEDPKDPTWEIRRRAKGTWANLDVNLGQWNSAIPELQEIAQNDTNPHRRTWAAAWLAQAKQLGRIRTANLRACGSQALGLMLASVDTRASKRVIGLTPPSSSGFTMEELVRIAARQGVTLKGFRVDSTGKAFQRPGARVEQLAKLPLPLLIHYNMAGDAGSSSTGFGLKPRGAAWASTAKDVVSVQATNEERALSAQIPRCPQCPPLSPSPASKSTAAKPNKIGVFRIHAIGHFLVVRSINLKNRTVAIEDPTARMAYTLSFGQLEHEWSGAGLMFTHGRTQPLLPLPGVRVASLDKESLATIRLLNKTEMARIRGGNGCCCFWNPPGGPGGPNGPAPPSPNGSGGPCAGKGSPVIQTDPISTDTFITDTPIWYNAAYGPDVSMTISYNTQDTTMYSPFGSKWHLNFGSSLTENPGGAVFVTEATGRTSTYVPNPMHTGYVAEVGNFNTLTKTGNSHFEVTAPTGEKNIYDTPRDINGNVLNVPSIVLTNTVDRFGYGLSVRYALYNHKISSAGYTALFVRITRIVDAQGRFTTLDYNTDDYCTRITDPFGRQARFTYNSAGQMLSVEDMGGDSFTYTYDSTDIVTSLQTAQGTWTLIHQFPGHIPPGSPNPSFYFYYYTVITDPSGHTNLYSLTDGVGYRWSDPNGHNTTYIANDAIDNVPVVTDIIYDNGAHEQMTWDHSTHQLKSSINGNGQTSYYAYNWLGNLTGMTDANGHTAQFVYDTNGLDLLQTKNTRGNIVSSATYYPNHLTQTTTLYPTRRPCTQLQDRLRPTPRPTTTRAGARCRA